MTFDASSTGQEIVSGAVVEKRRALLGLHRMFHAQVYNLVSFSRLRGSQAHCNNKKEPRVQASNNIIKARASFHSLRLYYIISPLYY